MCIISNSKRFIFIHVPKCAGSAISVHYANQSTCLDIEIGGTPLGESLQTVYTERFGLSKHSTLREIHQAIGAEQAQQFFTFGFCRNPYDRATSFFTFLRKWKGWSDQEAVSEMTDVNDFIDSSHFSGSGVDRLFKPQVFWLTYEVDGTTRSVDFIGRVEDTHNALWNINRRLGLSHIGTALKVVNESQGGSGSVSLQLELNRKSRDIINQRYAADFEFLGYRML